MRADLKADDFGAGRSPAEILSSVFGYDRFREEQEAIIDAVIAGESCCVLMPTGSGKSLCYQIPALCLSGVGVVVSPLIALMQDQVIALQELGIRAAAIHSALDYAQLNAAMDDLRAGRLDLVYVAPERLVNDAFLDILDDIDLALFAIDEAHCISQWGHDFRQEYRQLSLLRTRYPSVPCLAVTATADAPTRKDIIERLALPRVFISGFDRPNIMYSVAVKDNPRKQLLRFLSARDAGESGIVYCLSRRKVEETAQWLCGQGYKALPYHARLDAGAAAVRPADAAVGRWGDRADEAQLAGRRGAAVVEERVLERALVEFAGDRVERLAAVVESIGERALELHADRGLRTWMSCMHGRGKLT